MAINKQIKIARGSHTSIARITSDKLVAWEPIYDKDRKYLYIWNGEGEPSKNLNPIITNKIIGYIDGDDGGSSKYEFNANDTGAFIKSNTTQFDVKGIGSDNSILSATDLNLIFKGDLKSGYNTIYINSTDTLTATDISGRGGTLSNFGIVTGNRDITTGSGTISTSTRITTPEISGVNNTLSVDATSGVNFNGNIITPKISGVNNTLSIDATSSVSFNGNITATDKTITAKTFIGEYETGDDTLSINKWSNTAQGKTILRVKGNSFLYYESLLGVIAKPQTIVNSDIGVETLTSSSKNYIVGFGLDTKDKNINAGTGSVTAAKFIGNLDGTSTYADYASSDKSKGTIEERLTNLGFKQSSISLSSGFAAVQNSVTRQGNYVIGFAQVYGGTLADVKVSDAKWAYTDVVIGTLSNEFRPKTEQMFNCSVETDVLSTSESSIQIYTYSRIIISTNGTITLRMYYRSYRGTGQVIFQTRVASSAPSSAVASNVIQLNFGYEALPLK